MTHNSIVPCVGGKTQLSKKLGSIFWYLQRKNGCKTFVSPFGGGFHETLYLSLEDYDRTVYNEIEIILSDLFKVVTRADLLEQLIDKLCNEYEFTQDEYNEAFKYAKPENRAKCLELSIVERAYYGFIIKRQSFNAIESRFIYESKPANDRDKANFYSSVRKLRGFYNKYRNLEVYSTDGLDIIEKFRKDNDALLFIDPPYVTNHSIYTHDNGEKMHTKIAEMLCDKSTKCIWILCGIESELYRQLFGGKCLKYFAGSINKSSANSNGKSNKQEEYIWTSSNLDLMLDRMS